MEELRVAFSILVLCAAGSWGRCGNAGFALTLHAVLGLHAVIPKPWDPLHSHAVGKVA